MRGLVVVLAFTLVHTVLGVDIWGTGEVPRLADPAHVPRTFEALWSGYEKDYDKHNPLEAIVHRTWEREGGVEVNWVQLTVGTFQGRKAIVCGYWAYPKGAKGLPGIVMFHGGPQTASEDGAANWAKLGYACFHPNHNDKAEMGGEAKSLPNTDWGAVNAWGAKGPDSPFQADATTVDAVPSPRNDWQFPRQMSGRRIISFLVQQPQVDAKRVGVRGHSTGGTLTAYVCMDPRVAAAVPSVGGVGGFMDEHPVITGNTRHLRLQGERRKLFDETLESRTCWAHMHAPVLLLGASNDFNAPDWNCLEALKLATVDKRYASCANYNHSFPPETMVADYLWFQDKLKGAFAFPPTPKAELLLDREDGVPVFRVTPPKTDLALDRVEMFYTDGRNPLTRFWTTGAPRQNADGTWEIACPVLYNDEPLTAFANVVYAIDPIRAPHHRYDGLREMAATSDYACAMPEQLQQAGVKPSFQQNRLIDDFAAGLRDWGGELGNGHWWNIDTRKIADARFMGPKGAALVLEVNSPAPGQTMGIVLERNFMEANFREHAFYAFVELPEQGWNTVRLKPCDLRNPYGWPLDDWHKISRLALMSGPSLKNLVETNYARVAGDVAKRHGVGSARYAVDLGAVPDKVSGWDESYYRDGGDAYTKFNMTTKDDVLARQRFRDLRWEGGAYVARTKPYEREPYVHPPLTPPQVWKDYDPDEGDFREEIIREETTDGVYHRDSYISAYINGKEVRVYCKYAVKADAKNAPGLMNVHGWMGGPAIDQAYVEDGWAVMAHDYSGITSRPHWTKYPDGLRHGHMEAGKMGYSLIYDRMPDGSQLTDPKATSHYLWNAVQRRALSYLLAQKEVDPERIGAKGYSYGGTIMWNLGMDPRVKAVVAYFGIGWINYYRDRAVWMHNDPYKEPQKTPGQELYLAAVAPQAHAPHITAASLWLNGSNDHHGGHERGEQTFRAFQPGVPWDFAIQARGHHNTEKLGDDCKLWLEKHVLGKDHFWPARPQSEITLDADGVPELRLTPASPERITKLQVYQCLKTANNIARSWRDVESVRDGAAWVAKLPVLNVDDYVFAYANIRYDNNCVVSSDFEAVIPAKLGNAVATDKKSDVISEGTGQWSNVAPAEGVGGIKGFRPLDNRWGTASKQFSDPKWQAPKGAALSFRFYCTQPQALVLEANGQFVTDLDITASDDWQSMTIEAEALKHKAHGHALDHWSAVNALAIKPKQGADITKVVFARFQWVVPPPQEPEPDTQGRVYLNTAMAEKAVSFHRLTQDKAWEGKSISVGGETYKRGLGVHADSEIVFPLDGKYASFHVVPGPDDAHKGVIEMRILVDGKEVFASGKVSSQGFKAKTLEIPVSGARELTLIVTDGGNGRGGDHASWADAYFTTEKEGQMTGSVSRDRSKTTDGPETLPPLKDGKAPATVEETWAGFDPRKEPLDVEVLKEWEEDGVVVKVLRYRVGIFKGKKAMMAAVYGYPKGGENLPGLVQLHGGGQSAQSSFVVKDAKNGYATISVAWAGRIAATEYTVTNKEKEMFWTGDTEDPDYMVTTDWGAVDAYHHHCRFKGNNFVQNPPSESTVDPVKSPRNSGWFLATLGARRAITFLEQQPQVDGDRIGVYGMSMGGKLTVLTAGADPRIKAAAPACGGLSDLSSRGRTLPAVADDEYLKRIVCPTIIMSPSNDFHSQVQDIPQAVKDMKCRDWRVVSSPNRNHGDNSEYSVGTRLWFDQFLKGTFEMAKTPDTTLTLKTADNTPAVSVTCDPSQTIRSVNVYYTQDGERKPAEKYWRLGKALQLGGTRTYQLPLLSIDKPLWVYADVQYALGRTVEGVGYSGEKVRTDTYQLASVVAMTSAESLRQAGAVVSLDESVVHEDFNTFQPGSDVRKAFPAFTFSDGISCVPDPGGRPGMSLEMRDGPDFDYAWKPLLTVNTAIAPFMDADKWTCSADVMLDAREPVPLTVEFRARDHQKKFTPIIVDDAGSISARGKTTTQLCTVKPGTWWTFSVTYDVSNSKDFQVKVQDADGTILAEKTIEIQGDVGAVNWVGFIAHGTATGSLYVDNVILRQAETPLE